MKLLIAIVNNDDANFVNSSLIGAGFNITKVSSTGGFLLNGNSTFLLGVEDDSVDNALDIIKANSKKREQDIPLTSIAQAPGSINSARVSVGGATVFIVDVEKYFRF